MDIINSVVWVCCIDMVYVQYRDISFIYFFYGVGVEEFNLLKKDIYVNLLILLCIFQVDEYRLESFCKIYLVSLYDDLNKFYVVFLFLFW